MTEARKEERAFEALLVSSARKIDTDEVNVDSIPAPGEKEREALEVLGMDFIDRVLKRSLPAIGGPNNDEFGTMALAGATDGAALLRADEVDEETAAELEENDNELIDRKKREQEQ